MPKSKDPCNQHACDIQACLQRNHYVMESCRQVILNLQKCCDECENRSKHCAALSGLIAQVTRTEPK
ncbi:hypothetical protein SELMODRAFT_74630 [Selaginella moellendorffii]|uniref:Cx9C motif-containing protein 4 n=1 Tax=Selaginella moellendorffii TaxID=88036 RepID=D8QMQ6_SELML|nr:cx9C motif-containing protein 4 [Selaginella moellendorffii]EFJ37973.1 hypothetical protein SELMODRAFT_74630 [Selaginella moellendorffii]|eukprot:XP_002960434.1 cx9C motif-containing protein 4 [Selaginella moellendorffii]